ncbi:hypothetical protein E4U57_006956, partial [Claviceps arundinis]
MSEIIKAPKLPSAQEIGTYDGKIPAERYFRRLGHTLKYVNGGEQVNPSTHIAMFELALEGDAAEFAETSSQIRSIMDRASQGTASDTDLGDLQQAFSVKFPPAVAEKKVAIGADVDIRQTEGEHLTDYYNRVLNLYQRAGGRDKPLPPSTSLSPAELFMRQHFVSRFIRGLHDRMLMQEAVGQRALTANSLGEAHEIVQEAATVLDSKASLAELLARDTRLSQLEELIRVQNGCSADEVISRVFPHGHNEGLGSPRPTLSVDSFYSQVQPVSQQPQARPQAVPPAHQSQPIPHQTQPTPQQTQPIPQQIQPIPQQIQPIPPQQPANTGYQQPYRPRQDRNYQNRGNTQAPRPPANIAGSGLRPATESTNQYVNGTTPLPRGGVCFTCGIAGHWSTHCSAPENARLQRWESAYLKSMIVPPTRDDGSWVPGQLNARLAQIYLDNDMLEDSVATTVPVDSAATACYAPIEAGPSCPVLHVQPLIQYGTTSESGAKRMDQQPRVEEVTDEESTLMPLVTNLSQASQATRESAAQGALWVMTLLSGAEPHQKKRKGMPIGELLSDDERGPAPLMREKIVNKNAKVLSQIWGRAGLGPIDWKTLAERISVPISLLDLWQISPELSRQFRKLSSRMIAPRKR